jgi:biopolymer transport protein ExbD
MSMGGSTSGNAGKRRTGHRQRRRTSIRLDMTPMVDIAFLLLIFYMSTTVFQPPAARAIELPSSHATHETPDTSVVTITVSARDSLFVDVTRPSEEDGQSGRERFITDVDLSDVASVVNSLRSSERATRIVVKADRSASYGFMSDLLDTLQAQNIQRVLLATDQEVALTTSGSSGAPTP